MFLIKAAIVVAAVLAVLAENCPNGGEIYARGISEEGKRIVIEVHNNKRLDLANGRIKKQPRAINLKRMSYDVVLGEKGKIVSDTCKMENIIVKDNRFSWVGQNLYMSWSILKSDKQEWKVAINSWFQEQKDFTYPNISHGVTGHYTQVAWADSELVGCDFISFYDASKPIYPYAKLYTCNYGPGGNILGQAPYQTGTSGCENLC